MASDTDTRRNGIDTTIQTTRQTTRTGVVVNASLKGAIGRRKKGVAKGRGITTITTDVRALSRSYTIARSGTPGIRVEE